MAGGLLFVRYINEIEKALSKVTGRKVFDDTIYYFNQIPTWSSPATVAWIVGGALFIAGGRERLAGPAGGEAAPGPGAAV